MSLEVRVVVAQRDTVGWPDVTFCDLSEIPNAGGCATGVALVEDENDSVRLATHLALAAHPGQVLLTDKAAMAARAVALFEIVDVGVHRLLDLGPPRRIWAVGSRPPTPAPRTLADYPTTITPPLTRLIGRRGEIDAIRGSISVGNALTLVGPAGVGKTRVALHAAAEALPLLPGGFWFVDLASVEPDHVTEVIANAVPDANDVRGILFDNCERVTTSLAHIVADLLASEHVAVVATSRMPLGVRGEKVQPVESLSVDDARALFRERSERWAPMRDLSDDDDIDALCGQLDRLPLAIELAATKLHLLSVDELAKQIAAGNDAAVAADDDDGRHRSLSTAIEVSYELLTETDRRLFRRLSLFATDFYLEAVEAIAGGEALQSLGHLVTSSLVTVVEVDGASRYRLLDTVRAFAWRQLAAEDSVDEAQRAFVAWALRRSSDVHQGRVDGDPLRVTRREYPNLLRALTWAHAHGHAEDALTLSTNLWSFWHVSRLTAEGRGWLERCIDSATDAAPDALARAHNALGNLALVDGDFDVAANAYAASLALRESINDEEGVANILGDMGVLERHRGDFPAALELYQRSLAAYERIGQRFGRAAMNTNLGDLATRMGDADAARRYLTAAVSLWSDQEAVLRAATLIALARVDDDAAALADPMATLVELGERSYLAEALATAIDIAASRRDAERVLWLAGALGALRNEAGEVVVPVDGEAVRDATELATATVSRSLAERLRRAGASADLQVVVGVASGGALPPTATNEWVKEGPVWRLTWADRTVHVADMKGMHYLAVLLASPHRVVPVLDLVRAVEGAVVAQSSTGDVLDAEARRAYTARIAELERTIERASDRRVISAAQDEIAALNAELGRAFGRGGRPRPQGDSIERARKATTNRVRDAIRRVAAVHPTLGAHLSATIRTGASPVYEPAQDARADWFVSTA